MTLLPGLRNPEECHLYLAEGCHLYIAATHTSPRGASPSARPAIAATSPTWTPSRRRRARGNTRALWRCPSSAACPLKARSRPFLACSIDADAECRPPGDQTGGPLFGQPLRPADEAPVRVLRRSLAFATLLILGDQALPIPSRRNHAQLIKNGVRRLVRCPIQLHRRHGLSRAD